MSLAVDLDNVLAETDAAVREVLSRTLMRPISRDEVTDFSYAASLGIDPQIETTALDELHSSLCKNLQPVADSRDALTRLSNLLSIHIVTSRPRTTEQDTLAWLTRHFGQPYPVSFCDGRSKLEICKDLGTTVLIEDKGETAAEARAQGILTLLINYPWNRHIPVGDGIIRAASWAEVYKIIIKETQSQKLLEPQLSRLVEAAALVSQLAHSPYSHFNVGAALQAFDGTEVVACNVESASYGLTCCAERAALFKAVSEGYRPGDFVAIGIASRSGHEGAGWKFATPCGACRQLLAEFSSATFPIVLAIRTDDGRVQVNSIDHYLPEPFLIPTSGAKSVKRYE